MKTRKTLSTIAGLLMAGAALAQQTGEIRGRVLDPDGNALFMATVHVERGGDLIGTTTDDDGRFVLKPKRESSETFCIFSMVSSRFFRHRHAAPCATDTWASRVLTHDANGHMTADGQRVLAWE